MKNQPIFNEESNLVENEKVQKEQYFPNEKPEYREQAKKIINEQLEYSDHAQMDKLEDVIKSLDREAGEIRNEFNDRVKELSEDELYKEEGKKEVYDAMYGETREKLLGIQSEFQERIKEYDSVVSKASKTALEGLNKSSNVNDLKDNDLAYIQIMLSRDDSLKTKYEIAEKYNFNRDVLDVLNVSGQKVNNPIEGNIKQLSRYQGDRHLTGTSGKSLGASIAINSKGDVFQQLNKLNNSIFENKTNTGIFK